MPVCKESFDLSGCEQGVRQLAQASHLHFVDNRIRHHRARHAVARLCLQSVAMLPISKWPAQLLIAEMVIPGELRDYSLPLPANRRQRKWAKTDRYERPSSGRDRSISRGVLRRGNNLSLLNARLVPLRHQENQIPRVREESKDLLDRTRNPLAGSKAMPHLSTLAMLKKQGGQQHPP